MGFPIFTIELANKKFSQENIGFKTELLAKMLIFMSALILQPLFLVLLSFLIGLCVALFPLSIYLYKKFSS